MGLAVACAAAVAPDDARGDACEGLRGQTITLIVPYSAGGGFDQLARLLAPYLERLSGAELVVSNVSGGGGLTGSKAIRDAAPDGRTIGIINGSEMAFLAVFGNADAPDPSRDYLVLGQLGVDPRVLLVAAGSPIHRIEDLRAGPSPRKLVVGVAGVAGAGALAVAGAGRLLGFEAELVGGFRGSKDADLALLRGDVEAVPRSTETALPQIRAGEMRAILRLAAEPGEGGPELADAPLLGGVDGLAARHAAASGQPVDEAVREADAYVEIGRLRRLVVAPAGLAPDMAECLERWVMAAARDPAFAADVARSGRSLQILPGTEALARLAAIGSHAPAILPVLKELTEHAR
jgi:tripartite-type tricarboxylate transporter receptor subunit TctC